jgi:bifunctional DNase/RNase
MISMWQLFRGEKYFWFQTDSKEVVNKMKRRNKFRLVSYSVNRDLWIFEAIFTRPDIARKALKTLAGNVVKFDKKEDIFYATIYVAEKENEAA